ncbi:S1C family serine protease [Thermodesulfobacteriota bacterium]
MKRRNYYRLIVLLSLMLSVFLSCQDPPEQTPKEKVAADKASKSKVPAEVGLTELVERIQPAVVTIIAIDKNRKARSQGTGFFIDEGGYLITNFHVLRGATEAVVKCYDGQIYPIEMVISEDEEADLIEVWVDIPEGSVNWAQVTDEKPKIAERVIVIGSPLGFDQTVSDGIVSGFHVPRSELELIQISAPISPGSSGSPVVNMKGEVIGVAKGIYAGGQNINFAIPGRYVLNLEEYESGITLAEWAGRSEDPDQTATSEEIPERTESPGYSRESVEPRGPIASRPYPRNPPIISVAPPLPDYPSVPAKFSGFMTPEYSNRDKYEEYVFRQIGGNPLDIDPMEEVRKAGAELPALFRRVFRGKRWSDRHRMTKHQANFWNEYIKTYREDVYNSAVSRRGTGISKYNWMMSQFDNAWNEYQTAIMKYEQQKAAYERWQAQQR